MYKTLKNFKEMVVNHYDLVEDWLLNESFDWEDRRFSLKNDKINILWFDDNDDYDWNLTDFYKEDSYKDLVKRLFEDLKPEIEKNKG